MYCQSKKRQYIEARSKFELLVTGSFKFETVYHRTKFTRTGRLLSQRCLRRKYSYKNSRTHRYTEIMYHYAAIIDRGRGDFDCCLR